MADIDDEQAKKQKEPEKPDLYLEDFRELMHEARKADNLWAFMSVLLTVYVLPIRAMIARIPLATAIWATISAGAVTMTQLIVAPRTPTDDLVMVRGVGMVPERILQSSIFVVAMVFSAAAVSALLHFSQRRWKSQHGNLTAAYEVGLPERSTSTSVAAAMENAGRALDDIEPLLSEERDEAEPEE